MELTVDTLEFHLDKKPKRFIIINNLPQFGIAIEKVFSKWLDHSSEITPESLCEFIRRENEQVICLTENEYFQKRMPNKKNNQQETKEIVAENK